MHLGAAIVLLALLLAFLVPGMIRHPWHAVVAVVIGVGLASATGACDWLMDRAKSSRHPLVRRWMDIQRKLIAVVNGAPPFNAGRWWIARALLHAAFYCAVLGATLATIVAIGKVFTQMGGA